MGDTQKCGSRRSSSCAMAKHAAMVIRGGAQKFLLACQLKRLLRIRRKNAELARGVSEETHLALAVLPVFAGLGSVPGWVEPTLEHAVGELAAIATAAPAAAVLRANLAGVMESPGVTPAGLLTRVGERAVGPVVAAAAGAVADLELVHAKVVGGIRVGHIIGIIIVVVVDAGVVRQELLQESLFGSGARVIHVGFLGGKSAAEELSRWDVYALEQFLGGRVELVGGVELVLVSTNAAHLWRNMRVFVPHRKKDGVYGDGNKGGGIDI
jgi:hypothetical protein